MRFQKHLPKNNDKPAHDTPEMRKMFVELYETAIARFPHVAHVPGRDSFRDKALTLGRPWYQLKHHVIDTFGEDGVPPPLQPTMLM